MPNEFRMNFSPEVVQGVVEQIRGDFERHDSGFADEASKAAIEAVRLAIELELAQRSGLPDYIHEAELKVVDYTERMAERIAVEMKRTVMEQQLDALVSEDGWFKTALDHFTARQGDIFNEVMAKRMKR